MDVNLLEMNQAVGESITTIESFGKRSGFQISYEKTTLYRISSIQKTQVKFYTKRLIKWSNDKINILGVDVVNDENELCRSKINYLPLMSKRKVL